MTGARSHGRRVVGLAGMPTGMIADRTVPGSVAADRSGRERDHTPEANDFRETIVRSDY